MPGGPRSAHESNWSYARPHGASVERAIVLLSHRALPGPISLKKCAIRIVDAVSAADTAALEARALFRNRHRRLIVCLLSLVLLIAQLGVEAHAYSHLTPDPHGVPSTIQSCGVCLSFAPLLSMVGGSHSVRVANLPESDHVPPGTTVSIAFRLPHAAFRARAPPHLL